MNLVGFVCSFCIAFATAKAGGVVINRTTFNFTRNNSTIKATISADIDYSNPVTPTMTHGTPPDSVNYTGLMNPSTDFDGCSSHWALSPVAIFEYWSNKNKTNQVFSAQAIVDCAPKKPANGCNGAGTNIGLAFEYAIESGLPDGNKYKYKASFGTCQASKNPSIWYLSNYCKTQLNGNEAVLQSIVAVYGPMMIQVVFDIQKAQKSYKSGVFSSDNCSATKTCDRQFFVVAGYGTDPVDGDYWIIRTNWGPSFGLNGSFLLKRGVNLLGVATAVWGPCDS